LVTSGLFLLLALCTLFQAGYVFYYFIPFLRYTPPVNLKPEFPVTVLLAAHNELRNLHRCLPAILQQQYPVFEVLVVDDRSTDGTTAYLKSLQQEFAHFKYIRVDKVANGAHPKKYALTKGVEAAAHEHLLLTDADCLPLSPDWITLMMQGFFQKTFIVLGFSPYSKNPGFLNHLIRYETLLTAIQYLSFAVKGEAYMGVGRNLAYTKTCFWESNGFDSHINTLGGDDDLFVQDAGRQQFINIAIKKESQTISLPKTTYREWIIQKRRHLHVGRYYKLPDQLRIGIFMMSNIFFYLLTFFLLFVPDNLMWLSILFTLRSIVVYLVYILIARRLKEPLTILLLPVLDIIYFLNYLVLGVSVLIFNKVRWK
jgi:glycosyltransferase involved in cell wall biosynthesis